MTNLTERWKKGELPEGEYYCKTGNGVEILRTWRGIDGYLNFENRCNEVFIGSMDDCEVLAEVPSYELWKAVHEQWKVAVNENAELKKRLAHVTRTQAKQFRDNQKLQVKAEHAKDVVNIDTARQIKQLKKLLRKHRDVFARTLALCIDLNFGEKQKNQFADDIAEIDQVLGEGQ